ncbi:MAG: SEL1-like repeat protein [Xanthobacteraceae bacterium]
MSMGATQTDQALHMGAEAEQFLRLGLMYSTGETVPADMVTAHKWFNIAGMRVRAKRSITAARSLAKCRPPILALRRAPRASGWSGIDREGHRGLRRNLLASARILFESEEETACVVLSP